MFPTNGVGELVVSALAKTASDTVLNPWVFDDRTEDADDDGLKNVDEYDGGNQPTDPHNPTSMWERYAETGLLPDDAEPQTDGQIRKLNDKLRKINLDPSDIKTDDDIDQVANTYELMAALLDPKGLWDLDTKNAWSDGETPDYFRVGTNNGTAFYLGGLFNGGEFIEPSARKAMGMLDRERAGTTDYNLSGWDAWSTARYSILNADNAGNSAGVVSEELMLLIRYWNIIRPGEFEGKTVGEAMDFFHEVWKGVKRILDAEGNVVVEGTGSISGPGVALVEADAAQTTSQVVAFFGGQAKMEETIALNKKDLTADEIVTPEPELNFVLKYAGNGSYNVILEAYQVNATYPEYGEQLTAQWTLSTKFEAGLAKLNAIRTPSAGALKQGPARFIAYIDNDGDGEFSASDTFGTVELDIGYLGATGEIRMGDPNTALPAFTFTGDGTNIASQIKIVRSAINGIPVVDPHTVYYRVYENNAQRQTIFPQDYVNAGWKWVKGTEDNPGHKGDEVKFIGLDHALSETDDIKVGRITSVTYDILVGPGPFTVSNLNCYAEIVSNLVKNAEGQEVWQFTTNFINTGAANRQFTVNYSPKADLPDVNVTADQLAGTDVTMSFTVPTDSATTKFWLEVKRNGSGVDMATFTKAADEDHKQEWVIGNNGEIGYLLPNAAQGVVTINLADYVKDGRLEVGEYSVKVALGSDKFASKPTGETAWSKAATFYVNKAAKFDGMLKVTVKHPLAEASEFADGLTVAVYETADLVNPVAVTTNVALNSEVTIDNLRPGRSYYVAAWYAKNNGHNRDQKVRKPYDTWGYATMLGVSESGFDALATAATAEGAPVTVYLQDTDWNDNGYIDRIEDKFIEEDWKYTRGGGSMIIYKDDFDLDGLPDAWQSIDDDPEEEEEEIKLTSKDVMAYYEAPNMLYVALSNDDSNTNLIWCAVIDRVALESKFTDYNHDLAVMLSDGTIKKQLSADQLDGLLYSTYDYYYSGSTDNLMREGPEKWQGIGTSVSYDDTWKVQDYRVGKAKFVHAQVYAIFGFDPKTCVADLDAVNTKDFAATDKYLVCRYLQQIGVAGVDEQLMVENPAYQWIWTLRENSKIADQDRDGVADGWELYTMFGPNYTFGQPLDATKFNADTLTNSMGKADGRYISPFTTVDGLANVLDNARLQIIEEFDNGFAPTDPWNNRTVDYADSRINDYEAYRWNLKTDESKLDDIDNDGLSNWAEFLASQLPEFKEKGIAFDVYNAYSVATNLPDYFVQCTVPDSEYQWYVGEMMDAEGLGLIADHDFLEDWWEDQYNVDYINRYVWDARRDKDGDGWSNFAEARAGTDPTRTATVGIDNYALAEYPIPMIKATVTSMTRQTIDGNIIIQAWSDTTLKTIPDAIWRTSLSAAGETGSEKQNERYLGRFQKMVRRFYLAPGSVGNASVKILVKDPVVFGDWFEIAYDVADAVDQTKGEIRVKESGKTIGTIDYLTGEVTVDFAAFPAKLTVRSEGGSSATSGATSGASTQSATYTVNGENCYVKVAYSSSVPGQAIPAVFYLTDAEPASDESKGHVREGTATFVAWADTVEANGVYDPGEPYGIVRNVSIGWDQVADFSIELKDQSVTLPRMNLGAGSVSADRDYLTVNADGQPYAPVYATNLAEQVVRIVRSTVNGRYNLTNANVKNRQVFTKKIDFTKRTVLTEGDILSGTRFDLDWLHLQEDARAMKVDGKDFDPKDIVSVGYRVILGDGEIRWSMLSNNNIVLTFENTFSSTRSAPLPISPTDSSRHVLQSAQPKFVWQGSEGYTAFMIEVVDPADPAKVLWTSGIRAMPASTTAGITWAAPIYVGCPFPDEKGAPTDVIFEDGKTYAWRIAQFNAKYSTIQTLDDRDKVWSDLTTFTTGVNTDNADTGYGRLAVDVRYYGPATNTLNDVVVEVFRTADFTGLPEARMRLAGTGSVQTLATTASPTTWTVPQTNVVFDGIAPGEVYVRAYIDGNRDTARATYESWGYVNKIGTKADDLYSPVAVKVVSTRSAIPTAMLVIEDTDVNQNTIPDCLEDMSGYVTRPDDVEENATGDGDAESKESDKTDADGDGLNGSEEDDVGTKATEWDTDKDGMPDGWEQKFANTDPLDESDAAEFAEGDAMAYAEKPGYAVTVMTVDGDKTNKTIYVVLDARNLPKVGDTANGLTMYTSYTYDTADGSRTGIGTNAVVALPEPATVTKVEPTTVALVHGQVYDEFGYNPKTATAAGLDDPAAHSKPFTALDKYLVVRYLQAMGLADEAAMNTNRTWAESTLVPNKIDANLNGIADAWELYTGLANGAASRTATTNGVFDVSKFFDREADYDGDGVKNVDEYNRGIDPFNPNSVDTDGDGINDDVAHKYGMHGDDKYRRDDDNDGLANFQEMMISQMEGFPKLDAMSMMTAGAENGGDQLVPDYFLRHGSLYLGEMFADHDFIEDWFEDEVETEAQKGGVAAAGLSRYAYDAHEDSDGDGWSNWAETRAKIAAGDITYDEIVTNVLTGVVSTNTITTSLYELMGGRPNPTVKFNVKYNGAHGNLAGQTVVVKAWSEENANDPDLSGKPDAVWTFTAANQIHLDQLVELNGTNLVSGALRGGKNTFVAYVTEESGVEEAYKPGLPYGIATGVEVGFAAAEAFTVEMTDVDPTIVRINLAEAMAEQAGAAGGLNDTNNPAANSECYGAVANLSDRGQFNGSTYVGLSEPFYMGTNMVTKYGNYVRVAILRSFINGQAHNDAIVGDSANLHYETYYGSGVLVERTFSLTDHPVLTEADLVAEDELDLDWGGAKAAYGARWQSITSVGYRIVVMDGTTANLETNNNLAICFENKFESGSKQTAAADLGVQVLAGRPTFAWTHANKISKRYPAFTLQLVAPDGTVVYDSGKLRAPARDQNGVYRWTAPFSVGTMTAQGYEILTDVDYTWRVSMLDAKFTTPNWATAKVRFSSTAGAADYGEIAVAVKYFGPGHVMTDYGPGIIRVQAFTTPDFSGRPVAETYVKHLKDEFGVNSLNATNRIEINALLTGLAKGGEYYVRAFIDTELDGARADWESWGYGNYIGTTRKDLYTPRAYKLAAKTADDMKVPDCVIYIEDADTNHNKLPDVWEWNKDGQLGGAHTVGVSTDSPYIVTVDGDEAKAANLFTVVDDGLVQLPYYSAVTKMANGDALSSLSLALAMYGVDLDEVAMQPEVKITSFSLADGIALEVKPRATVDGEMLIPKAVKVSAKITLILEGANDLGGPWDPAGSAEVMVELDREQTTIPQEKLQELNDQLKSAISDDYRFFRVRATVGAE